MASAAMEIADLGFLSGITAHAAARARQRAIPAFLIDLLRRYGREQHDGRGGVILFFDRAARERVRAQAEARELARNSHWLNAYAVEGRDGALVTVGWRRRRINRK